MNDQNAVQPGPRHPIDIAPPAEPGKRGSGPRLTVCGLLLAAVGLVFAQTAGFGFVNFDDGGYVYDNPKISGGLTARGIAWVFTHQHVANWHPVTGMSHLLDCQLFGVNPGAHHLVNVLLQAATAVVLFLVLRQMTGRFWPSAMVAALFAVHPLRVESVAWISERKDVLSGLCFALTLAAYVRFVRGPASWRRYLPLLAIFALGLMAKPMLVTLPLVLLLLDYWPLGRFAGSPAAIEVPAHCREEAFAAKVSSPETILNRFPLPWRLIVEKVPLFLLTAASCLLTLWAQNSASAINLRVSFASRITNAAVSYVGYLVQLFWPVGLAAFYPHPEEDLPAWQFLASLLVLACVSLAAWAYRRRYPYLLVGWLWFLGVLVPVSGICQVGSQGMADRFTYLPHIGVYLALTWAAVDLGRSWPYRRWLFGAVAASVLAVFMGCAWRQTGFWRDSETLWNHALACTASNCVAQNNLGNTLMRSDRVEEAIAHYREALKVNDDYSEAHNNLANALAGQGRWDEAVAHYRWSLRVQPDYAEAYYNLGSLLAKRGKLDEAILQFRRALAITDYAEAHNNLGNVLSRCGRFDEALAEYQRALEINPDFADAHCNLGNTLARRGQLEQALAHYRQAVELKPDFALAYCDLGSGLRRAGRPREALPQLEKALELQPDLLDAHFELGLALSSLGRYDEALGQYRKALQKKPDDVTAHSRLAWLLATCPKASLRNGTEAVEHAQRADRLCGGTRPDVLDALAAGYAEAGWFPEALAAARKALELAVKQEQRALAEELRGRIALYEKGRPYRQPPQRSF